MVTCNYLLCVDIRVLSNEDCNRGKSGTPIFAGSSDNTRKKSVLPILSHIGRVVLSLLQRQFPLIYVNITVVS